MALRLVKKPEKAAQPAPPVAEPKPPKAATATALRARITEMYRALYGIAPLILVEPGPRPDEFTARVSAHGYPEHKGLPSIREDRALWNLADRFANVYLQRIRHLMAITRRVADAGIGSQTLVEETLYETREAKFIRRPTPPAPRYRHRNRSGS